MEAERVVPLVRAVEVAASVAPVEVLGLAGVNSEAPVATVAPVAATEVVEEGVVTAEVAEEGLAEATAEEVVHRDPETMAVHPEVEVA